VGRLENIIARNRGGNRPPERVMVMIMVGLVILLILGLAVFTDLGVPGDEQASPQLQQQRPHVDGVQLRRTPSGR
jgi:hypothetical protein